jgi:hypothetical protein
MHDSKIIENKFFKFILIIKDVKLIKLKEYQIY